MEQSKINYSELVAILAAGFLHVFSEIFFSETISIVVSILTVLVFLLYVIWRIFTTKKILKKWGLRFDNFHQSLIAFGLFFIIAGFVLYLVGNGSLSKSSIYIFLLYPIWGFAQQFALQNLIGLNLKPLVKNYFLYSLLIAVIFSISHFPNTLLVVLTFVAGFFLTLIYRFYLNLFVLGVVHGWLATLAIYLVLEIDPWLMIKSFLFNLPY